MAQPPALAEALAPLLRTRRFGRALRAYATVGSTNTEAAAWAAGGAPEGAVVLAELQTAGRGRMGRTWEARAGQNLTFSVVLRPPLPPERFGLLTLAASVAVAEAISAFTAPLEAGIKWPNDVLLEGRKCCGMLLESSFSGQKRAAAVILGIGLNVNQDAFPPTLADRATSMLLATGRRTPRAPLLAALLARLEHVYDRLVHDGGAALRQAYEARLAGLGRPATLYLAETRAPVRGVLAGITATGALRVETGDGPRLFHAGEVSFSPPNP
ncbi:biotin--[acetyl-CoA-carboxylase] ligase [Rhodocaloribacter sp.]